VVETSGIRVEAGPDETVVRLEGDIDIALRDEAGLAMAAVLAHDARVVVDASDATFVDSSGIAFVLQLQHAVTEAGLRVSLRDPHRVVRDVLEVLGVDTLLDADEPEPALTPLRDVSPQLR